MSINSLLFTARDSLTAHQMAISVVGSNIANVNTPGYNRQRADLVTIGAINVNGLNAQIGVSVNQVSRIYDRYIDSQMIQQQQTTSYSDAMLQSLQNIQTILDDTNGGGINEALDQFWASWEDLSNNPSGTLERNTLLSTAESLAETFVSYRQSLDSVNTELNRSIADIVPQINDKIQEIADINALIIKEGGTSKNEGDLNNILDKRTYALKELGEMINITYFEADDGTVNVSLANGQPLLQGTMAQTLSVVENNGKTDIYNSNSPGTVVNDTITGGTLGAYLELQHSILPKYINELNDVVQTVATRVNELHSSGFDADGNIGLDLFSITDANNPSGSIGINPIIAVDINRIAASASVSGDGENATRIATVRDEFLMNGNKETVSGFLASMVGEIGRQTADAETNNEHQTAVMNYLSNQRESISGVSIDEEMILLTKYQMGYTAAGKLCTVVNEMLDVLMNIVS
jgi:flagellar hook-associated protein 1